eukprot:TRINITY_DN2442_c0_g1_i1.p1 TRINITY_DN2442_c0_g1~~TRINITY_DN2442_c0_g1_i1.p1  ORF type:complete len:279 (+),score=61.49 TRINITY_DN2442_c0_g1_i1:49-837(+)
MADTEKEAPVKTPEKTEEKKKKTRVPKVPESILKKRKTLKRVSDARKKAKTIGHKKGIARRKVIFKRAEAYVREYRKREKDEVRLRKLAKKQGNFYVADEPKLAFVIRIRGINGVSPQVRKILQLLRLRQINNGVFIRINKSTHNMLRLVEPYIAWGYPNLKSVRELIYKRGFGKIHGQRIALTDNELVRKSLGHKGIICMEDLIHQIFTVGPHFKRTSNFLWPFKLSHPKGGMSKKGTHFVEGGDHGNREDYINNMIRRMN